MRPLLSPIGAAYLLAALLCPGGAAAQVTPGPVAPPARPPEPATKFESFVARGNNLFVKEYHPAGELAGKYGTRATFEAVTVLSASDNTRVFALLVERPGTTQYESDESGVVDFDEVLALQGAIDLMIAKAKEMGAAAVDYTEIEYTTRGGLSVGFFQKDAKQTGFVKVSKYSSHGSVYFDMQHLPELREIVHAAAEKLRGLGAR